jgi:hypothetical protein
MASTYLSRTPTTENINKLTLSCWVKRGSLGSTQRILSNSSSEYFFYRFESSDQNRFNIVVDGGETTLKTNRLFRDTSAWYHIVIRWDTTQATEADRIKLYVNGVQETSFAQATYPALNSNSDMFNSGTPFEIGRHDDANSEYFDGSMAHVHFIDGTAYDASAFGETDATTGIWKPKTAPSVTYGTNGFFLKFENSASFGTDSSPNANNFTVNGTMTQTIDTPSNVFATLNPLIPSNGSFSEGNNTVTTSTSTWSTVGSTLGVTSGKYYWEVKANLLSGSTSDFYTMIGFVRLQGNSSDLGNTITAYIGNTNGVGIYSGDGNLYYSGGSATYGSSYQTSGTIIGIALDLDNNYAYWSINGTWQNSGDPTSGATGTGGYNLSSFADGNFIVPASSVQNYGSANQSENEYNFGNGTFGTTAVSSAENPDDGIGIFEYEVPTGYKALCTKSINAQEYS